MVKLITYNTLYFNYSDGAISYTDQLNNVMDLISVEEPDIACLLEMPNPHQEVKSETLLLCEQLEILTNWFHKKGYMYIKCLNNMLSIWIVSKFELRPLLLLGASTVSGAMNKLLLNPQFGPTVQITQSSNYIDCFKAACCSKDDRSLITGVMIGSNLLPLVVVHDKCLFWNSRYYNLRFHFLSAVVSTYGLVVGDFNGNLHTWGKENLINDPRLDIEIPTVSAIFRSWSQGVAHLPKEKNCEIIPTAISTKFPYEALYIDGAFTNAKSVIRVTRSEHRNISDHMPIVVEFDTSLALPDVNKAKKGCLHWFQSQGELARTFNQHFELPYTNISQAPPISPVVIESTSQTIIPEPLHVPVSYAPRLPNRLRGEALPLPPPNESKSQPEVQSPNLQPLQDSFISETDLKLAAEYLRSKYPNVKICHATLGNTKERTFMNSYGPSCHFNCKHMHEKSLEGHPALLNLVNKENTFENGSLWRNICAYQSCTGCHTVKALPSVSV